MTGTWVGYYKFDDENHQKASGFDKTFFTITINSFDKNVFTGIVIDDTESGGMEGKGEVIGEVKDENIIGRLKVNLVENSSQSIKRIKTEILIRP